MLGERGGDKGEREGEESQRECKIQNPRGP
jgi:hypothetical protein